MMFYDCFDTGKVEQSLPPLMFVSIVFPGHRSFRLTPTSDKKVKREKGEIAI